MPKIREYEQQTSVTTGGIGGIQSRAASPSDFGAGAGLADIGENLQRTGFSLAAVERDAQERKAKREEQGELVNAQVAFSTVDADLAVKLQDSARNAKPGDLAFADNMVQEATVALEKAREGFTSPAAQSYFSLNAARSIAEIRQRANMMQAKISADGTVLAHETEMKNVTAKVNADPSYFSSVTDLASRIRARQGIYQHLDVNSSEKLAQQTENEGAMVLGLKMAQSDPQNTLGAISPAALQANTPISFGNSPMPKQLAPYSAAINANANKFGVPAGILAAQLMAESAGNPNAVNKADIRVTGSPSIGIAQFQPATAKQYGIDPTNPEQAIKGQANYMSDLLKKYGGDTRLALAAYNWGPGNLDAAIAKAKGGPVRFPASTEKYVGKILSAAGGSKSPTSEPQAPLASEPAWAKYLTPEQRRQLEHVSTTQLNHQRAYARADIEQKVRDQAAQAMTTGYAGTELKQQEFLNAYGPEEGAKKYRDEYLPVIKFGKDVASVVPMTNAAQDQLLESARPVIGQAHYADQQARFEALGKAVDHARKARSSDPMQFAIDNRLPGVAPLDMTSLDKAADGIVSRQAMAQTQAKSYGTKLSLLTNSESMQIATALRDKPTSEKINFIKKLSNGMTDRSAFNSMLSQATHGSPEVLVAASLLGDKEAAKRVGPQQLELTSGLILEGQALLNKSPADGKADGAFRAFPMPKEAELHTAFVKAVGTSFAGQPGAMDATYQAVKAYYAGASARHGNAEGRDKTNSALLKESIANVIGNVVNINGRGDVIAPMGVERSDFKDYLEGSFDRAAPEYAGRFSAFGVQGAQGGKYIVMNGDSPLRDSKGRVVVLQPNMQLPPVNPGLQLTQRESSDVSMLPTGGRAFVNPYIGGKSFDVSGAIDPTMLPTGGRAGVPPAQ